MDYSFGRLNSQFDMPILAGNLRVAPFEVAQLLEVNIQQKINEHATFYLKGVLTENQEDDYASLPIEGTNVVLSADDPNGDERNIYTTLPANLKSSSRLPMIRSRLYTGSGSLRRRWM